MRRAMISAYITIGSYVAARSPRVSGATVSSENRMESTRNEMLTHYLNVMSGDAYQARGFQRPIDITALAHNPAVFCCRSKAAARAEHLTGRPWGYVEQCRFLLTRCRNTSRHPSRQGVCRVAPAGRSPATRSVIRPQTKYSLPYANHVLSP